MPDHVHLFVRGDSNFILSSWIRGLKRSISVAQGEIVLIDRTQRRRIGAADTAAAT